MRRAARKDDNHNELSRALLSLGCSVLDTSRLGEGFGDVVVGYGGRSFVVEFKDGSKPASARKLTPAQVKFKQDWKGDHTILECVQDCKDFVAQIEYDLKEWK